MSDSVEAAIKALEAVPYVEGGTRTTEAIDRVIAAYAAQQASQANRTVYAGGWEIEQPVAETTMPTPPAEPVGTLPSEFLPYAGEIHAAPSRSPVGHTLIGLLRGVQPHEVVSGVAQPEEKAAALQKVEAAVGPQIMDDFRAVIAKAGLQRLVADKGYASSEEIVRMVAGWRHCA